MADDEQGDSLDPRWAVRLSSVGRLDRDDEDEGEDFYDVEFELSGLGVSGTVSVLITDPVHEASVIVEALQQLHGGLETFARVVDRRKSAEPIEPDQG